MFALILAPVQPALLAQLVQVQVTLTCSDGTEITDTLLVVDSAALAALQSAVEAMALYPAGLTCRLTQQLGESLGGLFAPLVAFAQSSGGNPVWNYTVGGGRAVISFNCPGEETNFGFSARVEPVSNGTPGQGQGTFNLTIPQSVLAKPITSSNDVRRFLACMCRLLALMRHHEAIRSCPLTE